MYKCVCGKEFKSMNALHGHRSKCNVYKKELNDIINRHLTKDFLEWWYLSKRKSANLLSKILNNRYQPLFSIGPGKIIYRCKKLGIPTWSIKESNNLPHVKKKRHENNNLAKNTIGYLKRKETLAKEGIVNVFQRKSVKEKIKETLKEKYGVTNPIYLIQKCNNGNESKPHIKTIEFLKSLGYELNKDFISEERKLLNGFNKDLNRMYCPRPDIIFPSKKLVIEIYGNRWHANPNMYNDEDIIHLWAGDFTAKEIRDKDRLRINHIKSLGYDVIVLWEDEIYNNNFDKIIEYGI